MNSGSRVAVCLSLMLPFAHAWAEGGVRRFDCTVVRTCDSAGTCNAGSETMTFSLAPASLSADGSGQYEIRYASVRASMQAVSDVGPFYWRSGEEQNTLLMSSDSQLLWHQLHLSPTPAAKIRFLSCRIQP
jgi:hypothetical protein